MLKRFQHIIKFIKKSTVKLCAILLILILFEPFAFETNFTTVTSCFNNIGPSFGEAALNYDCYSYFSKIVLSFAMLLGRLEIFPMLILFSPSIWKKRKAKS